MNVKIDTLVDIVLAEQKRLRCVLDLAEVYEIIELTIRKCQIKGKSASYISVLLADEIRDYVHRKEINRIGEMNSCVMYA